MENTENQNTINEMLGKIDEELECERLQDGVEEEDPFTVRYARSGKPVTMIREEAKRRGVSGAQIAKELKEAGLPVPKFYTDEMLAKRREYARLGAEASRKKEKTEQKKEQPAEQMNAQKEVRTTEAARMPEEAPKAAKKMQEKTKETVLWAVSEELRRMLKRRDELQDEMKRADEVIEKLNAAFREVEEA